MEQTHFKRIAALDIGTNSFHVVIVDVYSDGTYKSHDKYKEMVGLGDDIVNGKLTDETMDRALSAMKKIQLLCEHQEVEEVIAYATSAVRETSNGGEFIQKVIDLTGIKIQAIPGNKEGMLIGKAVQRAVMLSSRPALIVDIGGGSVEFILADKDNIHFIKSLKIGVGRTLAQFVHNDPIEKDEIEEMEQHFRQAMVKITRAISEHQPTMMVGSSGTMENIAEMIAKRQKQDTSVTLNEFEYTPEQFEDLYNDFITKDKEERLSVSGLDDKRVDLIIPGLILTRLIIRQFGFKRMKASTDALREGMILDYIERNKNKFKHLDEFETARDRSIYQLLERYNWHKNHSEHVRKIALKLFDDLQPWHQLSFHDRELLGYACLMHDIGYYISRRKHHKHALYIIQNSEIRGFDNQEIQIMAHVARYHRRSTPKKRHEQYHNLPSDVRKRIKKLSAFMRVADGLDRSHFQLVTKVRAKMEKKSVVITIENDEDPQLEIWGANRKKELMEELFDKDIEIEAGTLEEEEEL